jgi:hypothetical protein
LVTCDAERIVVGDRVFLWKPRERPRRWQASSRKLPLWPQRCQRPRVLMPPRRYRRNLALSFDLTGSPPIHARHERSLPARMARSRPCSKPPAQPQGAAGSDYPVTPEQAARLSIARFTMVSSARPRSSAKGIEGGWQRWAQTRDDLCQYQWGLDREGR